MDFAVRVLRLKTLLQLMQLPLRSVEQKKIKKAVKHNVCVSVCVFGVGGEQ
jgi:hypothetical protein